MLEFPDFSASNPNNSLRDLFKQENNEHNTSIIKLQPQFCFLLVWSVYYNPLDGCHKWPFRLSRIVLDGIFLSTVPICMLSMTDYCKVKDSINAINCPLSFQFKSVCMTGLK
ncbi:hypothetical protein XENOCAPTIV_019504 [Xenoophorus captivus]|uniref:Uncharacterized protein n=1 Tax=Xenoophorus captivus TaxID=1517983 RepID=A0ABV0S151_9TELE